MTLLLTTLIGAIVGLAWAVLYGLKDRVERRTGVLWGTYRWADAPRVFLAVGRCDRADTVLEVGVAGRHLYVFRCRD
jgi:hypothetical protein